MEETLISDYRVNHGYRVYEHLSFTEFMEMMPEDIKIVEYRHPSIDLNPEHESFGREDYAVLAKPETPQTILSPAAKGKMQSALQSLEPSASSDAFLIQFWAPVKIGGQTVLSTAELPFGTYNFRRGICTYRTQCMNYYYRADWGDYDEEWVNPGPPTRVFLSGNAEFNADLGNYSIKEFPLRDDAQRVLATTSSFQPVYELQGEQCIGVVELITFSRWNDNDWQKCYGEPLSIALQSANLTVKEELCISMTRKSFDLTSELKKFLEALCKVHKVPFAKAWELSWCRRIHSMTWTTMFHEGNSRDYSPLIKRSRTLEDDQGVVGKAFSSHTTCFCRNITQLSTSIYPFAYGAFQAGIEGSLAVCLRHSRSGFKTFVFEFFWSSSEIELWKNVESLLATINKFPTYRQAYGELGKDIQILTPSADNELGYSIDFVSISLSSPRINCQYNGREGIPQNSIPEKIVQQIVDSDFVNRLPTEAELQKNGGGAMQMDPCSSSTLGNEGDDSDILQQHVNASITENQQTGFEDTPITCQVLEQYIGSKLDDMAKFLGVSRSTLKRICRRNGIRDWGSYCRRKARHALQQTRPFPEAPDQMTDDQHVVSGNDNASAERVRSQPQERILQSTTNITVKASYGGDLIRFELHPVSRMTNLLEEIRKRINLRANSFTAKYEDEDGDWILLACDEDLQKYMSVVRSLGKNLAIIRIESIPSRPC